MKIHTQDIRITIGMFSPFILVLNLIIITESEAWILVMFCLILADELGHITLVGLFLLMKNENHNADHFMLPGLLGASDLRW